MTVLQDIFNRLGIGVGMVISYLPQSLVANLKKVLGENLSIVVESIDPNENKCVVKITNSDGNDIMYCEYTYSERTYNTNDTHLVVTSLNIVHEVLK